MSRLKTKPTKWSVRPAKTQINLGIRPVWSESSLSAWRSTGTLATHWAHSEDSHQTGWMPRLIRIFAGCTYYFVDFVNFYAYCCWMELYYCRTCFSMGDLGVQVSVRSSVRSSIRQHLPWVSCERNPSYSFVPIFLKLCTCFRHGMRMCMWFGYNCKIIFCHFLHFVNLVIFFTSMNRQWVPCERNSSYNFIPIFLKLCIRFLHGLKMCMWFRYNPCIKFCYFFPLCELCHFLTSDSMKV